MEFVDYLFLEISRQVEFHFDQIWKHFKYYQSKVAKWSLNEYKLTLIYICLIMAHMDESHMRALFSLIKYVINVIYSQMTGTNNYFAMYLKQ